MLNKPTQKLSIVTCGRADNYGGDATGRLYKSVDDNCSALENAGIDYEYLIIDWSPVEKPLYYHSRTKELFDKYNIKDIVVDQSMLVKENFHPTKVMEYFGKNIGLRQSAFENILITNCDIIFGKQLVQEIKHLITIGLDMSKFYRTHLRSQVHPEDGRILWTDELYIPNQFDDSHLCAGYGGDFLMAHRDVLINDAQGYDELSDTHRRGTQTSCDGEILWKLDSLGIKLRLLDSPYFHIYHGKDNRRYDSIGYTKGYYKQKTNWGFIDYPVREEVLDKLYIIYANN